jgi:hypothetical protein
MYAEASYGTTRQSANTPAQVEPFRLKAITTKSKTHIVRAIACLTGLLLGGDQDLLDAFEESASAATCRPDEAGLQS